MFRRSEGIQSSQGFMERTLIDACSAGSYIKACGHFGMMHIATHTHAHVHIDKQTHAVIMFSKLWIWINVLRVLSLHISMQIFIFAAIEAE